MTRLIIGALAVGLALAIGAVALSQSTRTANIEVRVWEDVNDPERNFISARPEGGSWSTLGTIPLPLTDGVSSSGRFRYGDITLAVPVPEARGVGSADYWQEQARVARQGEEWAQAAANLALDQRDACYADLRAARATPRQTCDYATIERIAQAEADGVLRAVQANNAACASLPARERQYCSGPMSVNYSAAVAAARARLQQQYCR